MKIYIVGAVGSGKSTLSRKLSDALGIICYSLDLIQFDGNRRRNVKERDKIFNEILAEEDWIIEDAGRKCFFEGMVKADTIIYLDMPILVVCYRILARWIKQKRDIEECEYPVSFRLLIKMYFWYFDHLIGKDGLQDRLREFGGKTIKLSSRKELNDIGHLISNIKIFTKAVCR